MLAPDAAINLSVCWFGLSMCDLNKELCLAVSACSLSCE